jgi:hypothetical protein
MNGISCRSARSREISACFFVRVLRRGCSSTAGHRIHFETCNLRRSSTHRRKASSLGEPRRRAAAASTSKRVGRAGSRQTSTESTTGRTASASASAVSKIATVKPTSANPSRIAGSCGSRSVSSGSTTTFSGDSQPFAAQTSVPMRSSAITFSPAARPRLPTPSSLRLVGSLMGASTIYHIAVAVGRCCLDRNA